MLKWARFRFSELLLGILLSVAVFAMGMMFESSRRLPSQNEPPGQSTTSNSQHEVHRTIWNWISSDAAGFFTFWLVIVGLGQAGLFYWQLKLIRGTLKPAEDAAKAAAEGAEAAKLNAQAVVDAERARVFVIIDQDTTDSIRSAARFVNSPQMDDGVISTNVGLFYGFKNYGKTPAIIKEMSAQIILASNLPKERDYAVKAPLPFDHILAADQRTELQTLSCSLNHKINVGTAKDIQALETAIWFYGYISYDDTFGWGRELRFIFNYDGSTGGRFRLYSYREIQSTQRHPD